MQGTEISARVKLPTGWVRLPKGSYEIGRSVHCQVVLEGTKVSRLHARLVVSEEGVTIEDLGSANGVFVNGKRVSRGAVRLESRDALVIGDISLEIAIEQGSGEESSSSEGSERPTLLQAPEDSRPPKDPGVTTRANALELLGTVAEQAKNAGDARRAEGILETRLQQVLDQARRQRTDPESSKLAFRLSLLLAKALPSARWFDFAVDLLTATATLPRDEQLGMLESAAAVLSGIDTRKLQSLSAMIATHPPSMDKVRALSRIEAISSKAKR